MGRYKKANCGNCFEPFMGYFKDHGIFAANLGTPYIHCKNCDKINKTGNLYWTKFPLWKKIYYWMPEFIAAGFIGILIGLFSVLYYKDITPFFLVEFALLLILYPFGAIIIKLDSLETDYNDRS